MSDRFSCNHPGCSKLFTRKDHLARHKLNHNNVARFECPVCKKKFKRLDVMSDHHERHFRQRKVPRPPPKTEKAFPDDRLKWNATTSDNLLDWVLNDADLPLTFRSGLLDALFVELYPNAMLEELLGYDFNYLPPVNSALVTLEMLDIYTLMIPELRQQPDFSTSSFTYCIEVYWSLFHIQYPILHQPSFNTLSANPVLTLAMIMMGATMSNCINSRLADATRLAFTIGDELRWIIFKHRGRGLSEPWEFQSLLILEIFEKYYSTREHHERSSVHQGAKIEMMKRSPVLGGDPFAESRTALVQGPNDLFSNDDDANVADALQKWVAAESMNRCALLLFCLDLTASVVSAHNSTLSVERLRLALPCEDYIWEADLETLGSIQLPGRPELIRNSFKKLLNREPVETTSFGKKIMFHTLLLILMMLQQKAEYNYYLGDGSPHMDEPWRNKLSHALDTWFFNINRDGCCNVDSVLINLSARDSDLKCDYLGLNDTRCKFPLYHMTHITLGITNHDLLIYAGAPVRMNVSARKQDVQNATIRVREWVTSETGRIGVVHAYLCICECLLVGGQISYQPERDPIPERPHIVVYSALLIWCYNFCSRGSASEDDNESAFAYLLRVKAYLDTELARDSPNEVAENVRRSASLLELFDDLHHVAGLMEELLRMYARCSWKLGREYSRLFECCRNRSRGKPQAFCENMYAD